VEVDFRLFNCLIDRHNRSKPIDTIRQHHAYSNIWWTASNDTSEAENCHTISTSFIASHVDPQQHDRKLKRRKWWRPRNSRCSDVAHSIELIAWSSNWKYSCDQTLHSVVTGIDSSSSWNMNEYLPFEIIVCERRCNRKRKQHSAN